VPGSEETLAIDSHRVEPVRQWVGVKGGVLPGVDGILFDSTTAGTGAVVELESDEARGAVVDAATGRPKSTGALPLENEYWTVYGGQVIGVQNDEVAKGREVLAGYKLAGFAKAWTLGLPAGQTVERVKPCGEFLVCAAVEAGEQSRVVAVDVRSGKEAWKAPVESGDDASWYVTPAGLVLGKATFSAVTEGSVLGPDGKALRALPEAGSVEAVHGGRMAIRCTRLAGTDVVWQVYAAAVGGEATKAVDVGAEAPEQLAVGGDLLGVVTKDRKVMVLRAKA
jgi:molecular chaperone HscA